MYLTNRFHVVVRLFSNRSQMTSKCGKNKKVAHEAQQKSNNISCKMCHTSSYVPDIKWSPQSLQNSVASVARSSLRIRASQAVQRSKLAFWASISTRLRKYDNILCPSLRSSDLSSRTPHKNSPLRENFKVTFKSVLGHIRLVLMLVLQVGKSPDVTSLLKWEWKFGRTRDAVGTRACGRRYFPQPFRVLPNLHECT